MVSVALRTVGVETFTKSDLEDISADDFSNYLDIGIKTFIERVENVSGATKWVLSHSQPFLEWVAETPDISDILLEKDTTLELFQWLLAPNPTLTIGGAIANAKVISNNNEGIFLDGSTIKACHDADTTPDADCDGTSTNDERLVSLQHFRPANKILNVIMDLQKINLVMILKLL